MATSCTTLELSEGTPALSSSHKQYVSAEYFSVLIFFHLYIVLSTVNRPSSQTMLRDKGSRRIGKGPSLED